METLQRSIILPASDVGSQSADELSGIHERQPTRHSKHRARKLDFAFEKRPIGKNMPASSRRRSLSAGCFFEVIDWSEDQASLPFRE